LVGLISAPPIVRRRLRGECMLKAEQGHALQSLKRLMISSVERAHAMRGPGSRAHLTTCVMSSRSIFQRHCLDSKTLLSEEYRALAASSIEEGISRLNVEARREIRVSGAS